MNPQTVLLYDGSFDGFLCCVFMVYDLKISYPNIKKESQKDNQLFSTTELVITEKHKAQRVWKGFKLKTSSNQQRELFKAFLSEIKGVENTLLSYMQTIFTKETNRNIDFSNKDILKISQVGRMVGREKHRMEAFVRFQLTTDNLYVATVEPDFNVLPLIISHFKDRYADQKWLIYDVKRNYGIYYDLKTVEVIVIENFTKVSSGIYAENEKDFQKLWSAYYHNVNIKSRKNIKLHKQHLPKRYWKYLIEKIQL
ncbi:TIGR03915 family putative DNA repair protein [Aquimarina sp. MMG016]|uniref:TIGR03915 family putative DNA repair protein n=1 Tax=Aquimarina sp. MMG016 TaxID=2822690 RepID=UPI001B3A1071|nr:TIGR03915 family putative DNA repair protein [Aquimarina sp. MMG016]MBQ4818540.1 TIGR03915 family putative DNA repair protein [Aquimarina sp. MMG016]